MAKGQGLTGLSFTDHMDIAAYREGLPPADSYSLRLVPGVELSTVMHDREEHLLVYGFDPDDSVLADFIRGCCADIWDTAGAVMDVFTQMGFSLCREDVRGWGRSVPTGVTFLDALMRRNRADRRLQAYLTGPKASSPYLNFYTDYALTDIGELVRKSLPDLVSTIRLLKGSGVLVLAHPGDASRPFLEELKQEGLLGIEAYSTHHDQGGTERLLGLARALGLLVSAGSDFHGERIKPLIRLGDTPGQPDAELMEAIAQRQSG